MDKQGNEGMNGRDLIAWIKSRDGRTRLTVGWMVEIISWEKETCGNDGVVF